MMETSTINLECPRCGKTGNGPRAEYDPPSAALYKVPCEECSVGCKIDGGEYFDVRGNRLEVP